MQPVPCVCRVAIRSDRKFERVAAAPQHVNRRPLEMTAFDQHSPRAQLSQTRGRAMQIADVGDSQPGQRFGLRHVRRDDGGEWQESLHNGRDRIVVEQACLAFRDHHRVEHDVRQAMAPHGVRDRLDDRGGREHADLGRAWAKISHDRVDLCGDHRR